MTGIFWQAPTAALAIGYLIGSIPFGVILTRVTGAGDLREIGSGNIGATNVLRTGRKGLAAATLVLDALKGWFAVWLVERLFPGQGVLAAVTVFLGHLYPIWLRFRGGKGVATLLGVSLGLLWPMGAIYAGMWLLLLALFRFSSVAGMGAAASAPVSAALLRFDLVPLMLALALLVIWRHRANLERLLAGIEPRLGARRG